MSDQPIRIPLEQRFWSKVIQHETGCWEWAGAKTSSGYGVLGRGRRGMGNVRASHVSWRIHCGPIPEGLWVLHRCDNPACCRPDHLFLGTAADNVHDCMNKGRDRFFQYDRDGPKNITRKVSNSEVEEIKKRYKAIPARRYGRVAFTKALAAEYNISIGHLRSIVAGRARAKELNGI